MAPLVMKVDWVGNFQIRADTGSRRHIGIPQANDYNPVGIAAVSSGKQGVSRWC